MSNILKRVRRSNKPFGGVPTLFVGDLLQLPPVVSSKEESIYFSDRYKSPHFFSADIFRQQQIIPVNLTQVRRQTDNKFIDALNHIRLGRNQGWQLLMRLKELQTHIEMIWTLFRNGWMSHVSN